MYLFQTKGTVGVGDSVSLSSVLWRAAAACPGPPRGIDQGRRDFRPSLQEDQQTRFPPSRADGGSRLHQKKEQIWSRAKGPDGLDPCRELSRKGFPAGTRARLGFILHREHSSKWCPWYRVCQRREPSAFLTIRLHTTGFFSPFDLMNLPN